MDPLIQHAQVLAEHNNTYRYLPIANRIAYLVDFNENSSLHNDKIIEVARSFKRKDLEPIYFVNSENSQLSRVTDNTRNWKLVDGVQVFNLDNWENEEQSIFSEIENFASKLYEHWKIFRPVAVILSGNLKSIVSGLIACARLNLVSFIELVNSERRDVFDLKSLSEIKPIFDIIGTFTLDSSFQGRELHTRLLNHESLATYISGKLELHKDSLMPKKLCFSEESRVNVSRIRKNLKETNDLVSYFSLLYKSIQRTGARVEAKYDVLIATNVENTPLKKGYSLRINDLAKSLVQHGRSVKTLWRVDDGFEISKSHLSSDGASNFDSCKVNSETAQGFIYQSYLKALHVLKVSTPRAIIIAGDFSIGLPILLAAKHLNIPVLKEHLHYSDFFRDECSLTYFEKLNFKHKFGLEKICFKYSQHCFYMVSVDDPCKENHIFDLIDSILSDDSEQQKIHNLEHKKSVSMESLITHIDSCYAEFTVDALNEGNEKGVVASFQFFDSKGKKLEGTFNGFSGSKAYPNYRYVDTRNRGTNHRVLVFNPPKNTCKVKLEIISFTSDGLLSISGAKLGSTSLKGIARWLSCGINDVNWIKTVESYVHKEGAQSLRLALLYFKYSISKHPNDLRLLESAVEEMIELDRYWIPDVGCSDKVLDVPNSKSVTVAHLHKTAYPYENTGGAIRCLNTVLSQKRLGMDPYIITPIGYPRFTGIKGAENYSIVEGIEHFRIGANTDGLRGLSLPQRTAYSAFYVASVLSKRGANLIHAASGVRGYELALQALALKKLTGLPLLYEVRSFHEHTWSPVRPDAIELERTQLRVIKEDFCMEQADFVTTISYSMRNILIERGVPESKIEVIPNSIDEFKYLGKEFSAAEIPDLKGADYVVGYISNMSKREGHEYLIRAIKVLRDTTTLNIKGLLVGNGPERDNLVKLIDSLGLREHIIMPGEVDHRDINSYYKAIDLFVIPRVPDYAADWVTPLKPYEAMALEVPIIVTDLPALKEIVGENEERGLIAEPANVGSLVLKLREYLDNQNLRREKVTVAKNWVFKERTWTANAKRYEFIYKKIIEQAQVGKSELTGKGELQHDS